MIMSGMGGGHLLYGRSWAAGEGGGHCPTLAETKTCDRMRKKRHGRATEEEENVYMIFWGAGVKGDVSDK